MDMIYIVYTFQTKAIIANAMNIIGINPTWHGNLFLYIRISPEY